MEMLKQHKMKGFIFAIALLSQQLMAQSPLDSATVKSTYLNADSVTSIKYRVSAGAAIIEPTVRPIYCNGYSYDFFSFNNGGLFRNSYGGIVSAEIIYNVKHIPVSLVADASYSLMNFAMYQFNDSGAQINESWFRKLSFTSVGLGFEVDSKYVIAGAKYRFGYCAGGENTDKMPNTPDIVKNGKLNLKTPFYQAMEMSLGAKFKQFHLVFRYALPLTKPIVNSNGWLGSFAAVSLSVGYTF